MSKRTTESSMPNVAQKMPMRSPKQDDGKPHLWPGGHLSEPPRAKAYTHNVGPETWHGKPDAAPNPAANMNRGSETEPDADDKERY